MTRRLGLIGAAVAVTACGSSTPTTPSPSPGATLAVQAGAWRGTLETLSCTGSLCESNPATFVLRLDGLGSGVLQLDARPWGTAPPIALDVQATASQDKLVVAGAKMGSTNGAGTLGLDARFELTEVGDRLAGTARYLLTRSSGVADKQTRILTAARDTSAFAARFQGRWAGFGTRTECSGSCDSNTFDSVMFNGNVDILLSQNGSALTGVFNGTAITGTASGSSFNASGRYQIAANRCVRGFDSGTVCLIEMEMSGSADAFDRMRGTVTYRVEGVSDRNVPYTITGKGDLAGLARWPFAF